MADDALDPKNLPPLAVKAESVGLIYYQGKAYRLSDGKLVKTPDDLPNAAKDSKAIDEIANAGGNPVGPSQPIAAASNLLGITPAGIARGGVILLGAALCIVGVVMLVSGTKTAALAKSLVPVVGKVL